MTRALCALFLACLGLGTTLFASGITAKNHALAEDLHHRERLFEMRAAAIEALHIRVNGRVVSEPLDAAEAQTEKDVQNGGAVSGSTSLGGSRSSASDVFSTREVSL